MIPIQEGLPEITKNTTKDLYSPSVRARIQNNVSDDIYTLDIEVSSLFELDGELQSFDYKRMPEEYTEVEKVSVPYIWMFGINDQVYYGREFYELENVFKAIYEKNNVKIIYIFNLSYEMQFLLNIFVGKYDVTNMVCRDIRKPIQFEVPELNLIFRCAYMLTNMSLETAAMQYTDVEKRSGEKYNYSLARSPYTELSDYELEYCEYDIICLYKIILHFKKLYKHLYKIPLTSTSIVRKKLVKAVSYWYMKKQWSLVPPPDIYLKLMSCFSGGYTHANVLKAYKVYQKVSSQDIASSYPAVMVTEKFPCKEFLKVDPEQYTEKKRKFYAFMLYVRFEDVKPKYYNHYIQACKVIKPRKIVYDNGRIVSMKSGELWLTDVDLDIILETYKCKFTIIECYKAKKDYLDVDVIKFILSLYCGKTTLKQAAKSDDTIAEVYQMMKGNLNSLYGVSVSNILNSGSTFIDGKWKARDFTDSFVEQKLEDYKSSFSNLFYYAVGVWVTAYARRNLFMQIIKIDTDMIYSDTDSIKYVGKHQDIFDEYNQNMVEKYKNVIKKYPELTLDDFMPKDEKGIKRPIGWYEYEETYDDFCTAGAKKYAYNDDTGLHITISGVNKKTGISALNGSINNFLKNGLVFNYQQSGRLVHYYNDNQPEFTFIDYQGNKYTSHYQYGIVLQPTTYTLGGTKATDVYIELVKYFERNKCLDVKQETELC